MLAQVPARTFTHTRSVAMRLRRLKSHVVIVVGTCGSKVSQAILYQYLNRPSDSVAMHDMVRMWFDNTYSWRHPLLTTHVGDNMYSDPTAFVRGQEFE